MEMILSANAVGEPGSTSQPVFCSSTISGSPPTRLAITGTPCAIAIKAEEQSLCQRRHDEKVEAIHKSVEAIEISHKTNLPLRIRDRVSPFEQFEQRSIAGQ